MCNVYLCVNKKTGTLYALKSICRTKIAKCKLEKYIMNERNVLIRIDHFCIVRLVKTFKDQERIYFLNEFMHGIDMWYAMREINVFSDELA